MQRNAQRRIRARGYMKPNDYVVIWEKNDGCKEKLLGATGSRTNKVTVALNAKGRRAMICDARSKELLVSDGVLILPFARRPVTGHYRNPQLDNALDERR